MSRARLVAWMAVVATALVALAEVSAKRWLETHVTSFTLDGEKLDAARLRSAYQR